MNNSYSYNLSNKSAVSSKSSVVLNSSSSKSASVVSKSASSSAKAAKPSAKKITPHVQSLDDRTSVDDVNDTVRNLKIMDKKGNTITAMLQAPGYQTLLNIDDARSVGTLIHNHPYMQTTTVNYDEHLFKIFHNLEVNGKPVFMGWHFADHHHEAFRWLMRQANSFLRDKFDAD